jgi:hypothetical protein
MIVYAVHRIRETALGIYLFIALSISRYNQKTKTTRMRKLRPARRSVLRIIGSIAHGVHQGLQLQHPAKTSQP